MRRGWPDALRCALLLSPARFLRCRKTCGLHLLGLFESEEKLVGQSRMSALHGGRRDKLEVSPNLWAGVGLVRGGAGTALVGSGQTGAARMQEYADLGIDSFILSGYPHLEEAYRVAELVLPRLRLNHGVPQAPTRVNTGPFGEIIANDVRPPARASAS